MGRSYREILTDNRGGMGLPRVKKIRNIGAERRFLIAMKRSGIHQAEQAE